MKPIENTENLVRRGKANVTTDPPMDKRVLDDSFAAMDETIAANKSSIVRMILRSRAMKLAAAAVLVMGLAIGALMGRDTWQSPGIQSGGKSQMAQVEPTAIYNLDYLTDAPKGSLADAYLTLVSATNGRER